MISEKEYLMRKINPHEFYPSDQFYLDLANRMLEEWNSGDLLKGFSEDGRKEVVLGLIGYFQDINSDLGLWRSFINHCRTLYDKWLPFYDDTQDYIEYELNLNDVKFLTWYGVAFYLPNDFQFINPHNAEIEALANNFYKELERCYDDAPEPEGMMKTNELDIHDTDDAEAITQLGHWLYWSSYLLVPAFKTNLYGLLHSKDASDKKALAHEMGEAQISCPTGPLALFLREWMWLLVMNRMPSERKKNQEQKIHPFYEAFLAANNGVPIKFFNSYSDMNLFFKEAFGWDDDDNLPQMKHENNFTLLVNEDKGMLVARNVAECICHSDNPYYNSEYAREHSFELLTQRGKCPIDLTLYCLKENLLPQLYWCGKEEFGKISAADADFIARCYLLQYYRAD
jgi:hypothetical protein